MHLLMRTPLDFRASWTAVQHPRMRERLGVFEYLLPERTPGNLVRALAQVLTVSALISTAQHYPCRLGIQQSPFKESPASIV